MGDEILLLIFFFLLRASATTSSLVTSKTFTRMTDTQCARFYFYKTGWFPRSENCLRACVLDESCATVNVVPTPSPVGVQCDFMSAIAPKEKLFASAGSECYTIHTSCVEGYCENGGTCVPGLYPDSPVNCTCLQLDAGRFDGDRCETFVARSSTADISLNLSSLRTVPSNVLASNVIIVYPPDQSGRRALLVSNSESPPSYIQLDRMTATNLYSAETDGWTLVVRVMPAITIHELSADPALCLFSLTSYNFSLELQRKKHLEYILSFRLDDVITTYSVVLDRDVFIADWFTLVVGQNIDGKTFISLGQGWIDTKKVAKESRSSCTSEDKDMVPRYFISFLKYWNRFLHNDLLAQELAQL